MANTSPEPFSNAALSLAEDVLVAGGSWLAVAQPVVFLAILAVFVLAALLMLRWIVRGAQRLLRRADDPADGSSAG